MRRVTSWLLSSIALMTLASCSSPQAPANSPTSVESPAAKASAPANQSTTQGFTALQNVVTKTKAAVEVGNFEQGKKEFDKFEDSWKTVEDGVKAKDSKTYGVIEEEMDSVNNGIKSKNKNNVLKELESLSKNIASVSKS